jgi:pilus assembly protein CpaD
MQDIGENEVKLTVRTYLVTLPGCPDFTSRSGRTFSNQPHSNWGCATATNLGRMVAEPKDILIGRGDTRADAEALVLSTQRYRAGETKALLIDDTATADSFGAQSSGGGGGGQ